MRRKTDLWMLSYNRTQSCEIRWKIDLLDVELQSNAKLRDALELENQRF